MAYYYPDDMKKELEKYSHNLEEIVEESLEEWANAKE